MRRAIVVAEAGDALGVKLDAAGRRRQPLVFRIVAELRQHHIVLGAPRHLDEALVPESVEIRNGGLLVRSRSRQRS